MKIAPNLASFSISAKGMSLQKKKMDLIAENIANINTTKTADGSAYRRKYLRIEEDPNFKRALGTEQNTISLKSNSANHIARPDVADGGSIAARKLKPEMMQDNTSGDMVHMPDHPDANEDGYVEMPNVNVVNEMVDMIAATRSYEANLTAFNASKQIARDSMEI